MEIFHIELISQMREENYENYLFIIIINIIYYLFIYYLFITIYYLFIYYSLFIIYYS